MSRKAYISGILGTRISSQERTLFAQSPPWGLILFARNCETPAQVTALVKEFRAIVGDSYAPILIDQEGGRVQRLKPPHWRAHPPARHYGELWLEDRQTGEEAAYMGAQEIAKDLHALGINVCCLPLLDIPVAGAHDIIGDRAYGEEVEIVTRLGRRVCEGLLSGGVLPVVKHIPGHGRAQVDSHEALPVVEASLESLRASDFAPFSALNDMPMAMTAHIVYQAIDAKQPATLSKTLIRQIIREEIGFDGLLMSDDISMKALKGDIGALSHAAIDAGCDMVLHCNGEIDEMRMVASNVPQITGKRQERAERVMRFQNAY